MEKIFYEQLDEILFSTKLPNGLTVHVVPRKNFSKKLAYFVTDFGAIHTEFTFEGQQHTMPAGIAHYLEHTLFHMPEERDVSAEFAAGKDSAAQFNGVHADFGKLFTYPYGVFQGQSVVLKILAVDLDQDWEFPAHFFTDSLKGFHVNS